MSVLATVFYDTLSEISWYWFQILRIFLNTKYRIFWPELFVYLDYISLKLQFFHAPGWQFPLVFGQQFPWVFHWHKMAIVKQTCKFKFLQENSYYTQIESNKDMSFVFGNIYISNISSKAQYSHCAT